MTTNPTPKTFAFFAPLASLRLSQKEDANQQSFQLHTPIQVAENTYKTVRHPTRYGLYCSLVVAPRYKLATFVCAAVCTRGTGCI